MSAATEGVLQRETKDCAPTPHQKNPAAPYGELPVLSSKHGAIREIESRIELIATSHVPVFITGESGTGKEVVARLVHRRSGKTPFVAINCAALPKDVIENELFGHEKGAFTGALLIKSGCFELANGGTLFLDEIAEMHPQTQAKLLRAIETKSFRRLGGRDEISVDARIIAATNKEPMAAMKAGLLREDLFYRLSVIELSVPPLRERPDDIVPLLEHYMFHLSRKYDRPQKRFSKKSLLYLESFDWPGNIRELRNLVERLVLICPEDEIQPAHLPPRMLRKESNPVQVSIAVGTSLEEAEKLLIARTLEQTRDNKAMAARMLGVSRKTLYDKLKSME